MEFNPVPPKVEALITGRWSGLTKTLRIMKLTAIFLLSAGLTASAHGFSQQVTLSEKDAPLPKVFKQIQKQTGFSFLYTQDMMKDAGTVTVELRNASLTEAVKACLNGKGLSFEIIDQTVVIKKEADKIDANLPPPPIDVKGRVLNEEGDPVVGASVTVKGDRSKGTTTDADGYFELKGVDENATVIISGTNIETREMNVNGKNDLGDIIAKIKIGAQEAVIVNTGYWTSSKQKSTSSIVKVTAKEIERQPVTNPLMALQGRVPGLDITPVSGVAGGRVKIEIRGRNSISNVNASPLYVIDGIPVDPAPIESNNSALLSSRGFDPLSAINPANIESIEVLKDADATAIYGSRGANGVILITTKQGGRTEKTNVDISLYTGVGKIPYFVDMLSTEQYVAMRKEAYANAGQTPSGSGANDLLVWDTTRYTNWQKEFLSGTANITDIQASVSSGTRFTRFRFGAGYHKEGMIFPGDFGYQRATGHFSLNHSSPNQKFRTALSMNYGIENNKIFNGTLVNSALSLAPNAPALYDQAGNLNWQNSTFNNPMAELEKTDVNKGNNININGRIGYTLIPGLTTSVNLGYNATNKDAVVRASPFSAIDPAKITSNTTAVGNFGVNKRSSWIVEPQINYDKKLHDHSLSFLLGATWQASESAYQLVEASGYTSDVLLGSLLGATAISYNRDDDKQYRYRAFFGRIGYDYQEKYLVNLTGRRDGSSRFGPDNRWGNFGALGAAWIFSKENFMQNMPFISFGKLRASYGVTGSDQVGDYEYLGTYGYLSNPYQGNVSLAPTGLANSNYAWEETRKLEAALELGLLNDRINLEAAWYRNRCSNQLLTVPLPGATGFLGVTENLGATVENRGWEFLLRTVNISRADFRWISAFNIAIPKNELIAYPGIEQSPYANTYVIGKPLNIVKLYNYIGVNPTTGLYEVEDVDGNGIFNISDQTFVQETGRHFYGGLNNILQYKGFELSFLLQFSKQTAFGDVFPTTGYSSNNARAEVFGNYWQKPGDIAKYQKLSRSFSEVYYPQSYANKSNAAYVTNSFIRLKTLSLSYSLPEKVLDKLSLKNCSLFVQGQNLWTLTSFDGLDPETGNLLPPMRMITAGLQIKL